jgi:hypothetical protein
MGVEFRNAIGGTRVKRGALPLWSLLGLAKEFTGTGLIKAR